MPRTVDLKKNAVPKPPHPHVALHHTQKEIHHTALEIDSKKSEEQQEKQVNVVPSDAILLGEWPAQSFLEYERSPLWYWWVGTGAALFSLFAIFTKDYLFFIFILIALFYIFTSIRKPATPLILELYDRGIKITDAWHSFLEYEDFSVINIGNECAQLFIHPKKKFQLPIDIYLLTEHAPEVKEVLSAFLPEIERQESFIHVLGRVLRF